MTKEEIQHKIIELKDEYLQIQHNLEKLEYVNGNIVPLEKRLVELEDELSEWNQQLRKMS
ncbi:hypothetical protein FZW96_04080 [Bacillus sp. BGMRC 2118]|nr:hypothetical protein FZW96_04080 [Bacillus sp. BGMRC 2118]